MAELFFDMWGTIIENGVFPSPVRQIKRILRLNMSFPDYITRFESVFMLNEFSDLTSAFEEVCKEFKISPPPYVIDKCVGLWNKNAILAKPFPETMETLKKLKENNKIYLVSNTDQFSADQVIKKFELNELFNDIILSHQFKLLKTSPNFFDKACEKFGINKNDVIMIGDSMESDIKPAVDSDVRAILIDRRERRDYESKVKTLEEIEELI